MVCFSPLATLERLRCKYTLFVSLDAKLFTDLRLYFQFPVNKNVSPEDVKAAWNKITAFDENATNPNSTAESLEAVSPTA